MGIKSLIKSVIAVNPPQTSYQEYPSNSVRLQDARDREIEAAYHAANKKRAGSKKRQW